MSIDGLGQNININKLKQAKNANNLSRKNEIDRNNPLSKESSIFSAQSTSNIQRRSGLSATNNTETNDVRQSSRLTSSTNVNQSRSVSKTNNTSGVKSTSGAGKQGGSSNLDIGNIDFNNLMQYSKTDLDGVKNNLQSMLDGNIDRSTFNSVKSKLTKVKSAIQQKSMNLSATQAKENEEKENQKVDNKNNTSTTTVKSKKEQDTASAQKAYEDAKSGVGGIGLAATIAATAKETKAGEETNKQTSIMESENNRMEKQVSANNKENEKIQAKMEKLAQVQAKNMQAQTAEEAKIQEEENKIIQTSAEIEEMGGSFSVSGAKSEDDAVKMEKQFNDAVEIKSQTMTGNNTSISQSQRKISNISKQYKNNIKTNSNYQKATKHLSRANNMSLTVAASNITKAQTTSASTTGIAEKAGQVGQLSTALGTSVSLAGQALEKTVYGAAVGAAMHTYGDLTAAAGGITTGVSTFVKSSASTTASAAATTTGSYTKGVSMNRRTDIKGKSLATQGKTMIKQTSTANKSARNVVQQARTTFAASISSTTTAKNAASASASEQMANIANTRPAANQNSGINQGGTVANNQNRATTGNPRMANPLGNNQMNNQNSGTTIASNNNRTTSTPLNNSSGNINNKPELDLKKKA